MFGPDYSATVAATKMWTNSTWAFYVLLDFYVATPNCLGFLGCFNTKSIDIRYCRLYTLDLVNFHWDRSVKYDVYRHFYTKMCFVLVCCVYDPKLLFYFTKKISVTLNGQRKRVLWKTFFLSLSKTAQQNLNTKMNLSFKGSFTRKSDFALGL